MRRNWPGLAWLPPAIALGLAALGVRGIVQGVVRAAEQGPLASGRSSHPRWPSRAYFDWLDRAAPARRLGRLVDAHLPPGAALGHVGSPWSLGEVRYHLWPRPILDRSSNRLVAEVAIGDLARAPCSVLVDHQGTLAAEVERSGRFRLLGQDPPYYLFAPVGRGRR